MKGLILVLLTAGFFFSILAQQSGGLDNAFNNSGKVVTAIAGLNLAYAVAIQADGKIVLAGRTDQDFVLIRYLENGKVDSAFGINGVVVTDLRGTYDFGTSVVIQGDGKILVAGASLDTTYNLFAGTIVRYTVDGTLDNTFSGDGKLFTTIGHDVGLLPSLAIQPDGKIIIAGSSPGPPYDDYVHLARYHANGTIDVTFGSNGNALEMIGGSIYINGIVLQPDGKIVGTGVISAFPANTRFDFLTVRFNNNGTLDTGFGDNGTITTDFNSSDDIAFSVAIQPDGKIAVAGTADSSYHFGVVRFLESGEPDTSFGQSGLQRIHFDEFTECRSLVIQPDGKIVLAGTSGAEVTAGTGYSDFALIRLMPDGSPDVSFGTAGKVTTDFTQYDGAGAIALAPDGKIVAAGFATTMGTDFALARYISGLNVGVVDFSVAENILIYPNPVQNVEVLEYVLTNDENLNIDLYDTQGKLIYSFLKGAFRKKGAQREVLHFAENLTPATYFLVLSTLNGHASIKITKL